MARILLHVRAPMGPWREQAACQGIDPDLFYPGVGHVENEKAAAAKAVCGDCSVRVQCLEYALEAGEEFGIWGGTSERERRRLRTARRKAKLPDIPGRGWKAEVTHCPQGHPYDEENTFYLPNGHRGCRTCRTKTRREYTRRVKGY